MQFVVILKTVKDLKKRPRNLKHVPDWFPLETTNIIEADNIESVSIRYPDSTILTLSEWQQVQADANKFDTKPKHKKWWQF